MTDPTPERGKAPAPCVTKLVNWIDEQLNGPGHETGHQSWLSDIADTLERQRAELDLVKRDERAKGVKRVVYPDVDPCDLDKQGGHYVRHIEAMTKEGLHHKFEIAEQLGARDLTIQRQRAEIEALTALVRELEWRPVGFGGVLGCPLCGGLKGNGHEPDCRARLAATGETDA